MLYRHMSITPRPSKIIIQSSPLKPEVMDIHQNSLLT